MNEKLTMTAVLAVVVVVALLGSSPAHGQCCAGPCPIDLYRHLSAEEKRKVWNRMVETMERAFIATDDALRRNDTRSAREGARDMMLAWWPLYRAFGYFPLCGEAEDSKTKDNSQFMLHVPGSGDGGWTRMMDNIQSAVTSLEGAVASNATLADARKWNREVRQGFLLLHERDGLVTHSDRVFRLYLHLTDLAVESRTSGNLRDRAALGECRAEIQELLDKCTQGKADAGKEEVALLASLIAELSSYGAAKAQSAKPDLSQEGRVLELAENLYVRYGRSLRVPVEQSLPPQTAHHMGSPEGQKPPRDAAKNADGRSSSNSQ